MRNRDKAHCYQEKVLLRHLTLLQALVTCVGVHGQSNHPRAKEDLSVMLVSDHLMQKSELPGAGKEKGPIKLGRDQDKKRRDKRHF